MTLKSLTSDELEVVRRAMLATFDYLTFDFSSRIGIEANEMHDLLNKWPHVDDSEDESGACLAVNNSLNDFLHGIGISDTEALEKIGVDRAEMRRIYGKWSTSRGWDRTGVR
jgi:hypothetical protein